MSRSRTSVLSGVFLLACALTLLLVLLTGKSSGIGGGFAPKSGASEESAATKPGLGPNSYEAYLQAARTYPANVIPPRIAARAKATFNRIARADARHRAKLARLHGRSFLAAGSKWKQYGPKHNATQPGVTSFSGATNNTASRVTALVVDPDCTANHCRVWVGVSGGGVWRTDDVLAPNPEWKKLGPNDLGQNSVGTLTLDPGDKKHDTLYLGTGEANRCSSGCEAGVGIYKSTDGGEHWKKLDDTCVNNATYTCAIPGNDAFLGRAVGSIVIDPTDKNHILVGSTLAVRGLSHVIGNGGTNRIEPGANEPGLYESVNGGKTFTEVWNGAKPDVIPIPGDGTFQGSYGVTDVGLDPSSPSVVYASAFDAGLYRRDAGAAATAFTQVFKPQFFQGLGVDRLMFALTTKSGHTRIYLTEGTQPSSSSNTTALAANFWRTDLGDQSAASLLASQPAACTAPDPTTHTFPATYTGWQCLTVKPAPGFSSSTNPYFASDNFCTQQCWYDQLVYTPAGMPDTVYLIGSNLYGEQPCNTNGVGCGNGVSNGREVLYSTTAGDPDGAATGAANMRTFTDLSYDATINHPSWCAFAPYFDQGCVNAPNGIHPDQHVIGINPGNPTQIFEGSDGGMIRTSGDFADVSSQCSESHRSGGGPLSANGQITCGRLLSRVPTVLDHVDKKLSSTLQFIGVAINPADGCEVMAGTQDNGTWSNLDNCQNKTWPQIIYGDGGNAGYDATNATWRFNEFTGGFSDSNFRNGDPEKWVITSAPVVNSGEGAAFYWPQISDPNPVSFNGNVTHPIYSGAKHVWRTWAFGAGHVGDVPQDTTPDIAGYEATCPEFVISGSDPACGDYRPLGGPMCVGIVQCGNAPGDLTGTVYGSDRSGGSISWLARDGADHGTLWAATSAGRIFVTHNADASDPAAVTWTRVDSALTGGGSPTRFPSGIYVDPSNPDHAWISYSGYNAITPTTRGHVFSVTNTGVSGGGTFTNLNVESGSSAYPTPTNDGDLPVSDIVRDDSTHTLYVGTDFGVLQGKNDGASWSTMQGMPRYEIMHLEMQPSNRVATCTTAGPCKKVLYAATHSRGIWKIDLKK